MPVANRWPCAKRRPPGAKQTKARREALFADKDKVMALTRALSISYAAKYRVKEASDEAVRAMSPMATVVTVKRLQGNARLPPFFRHDGQ